jgi:hypothetical protein
MKKTWLMQHQPQRREQPIVNPTSSNCRTTDPASAAKTTAGDFAENFLYCHKQNCVKFAAAL